MFLPGYVGLLPLSIFFLSFDYLRLYFVLFPIFKIELYMCDHFVARIHALSEYTPLCSSCGLVLCALQPPHRPCPHCSTPLLAPPARAALLAQLEELRAQVLTEEAEAREREAEELRLAEGSFPALSGSGFGPGPGSGFGSGGVGITAGGARGGAGAAGAGPGHRVLLVDSRTKRVKVESYSTHSRSGGLESEEEELGEAEAGIDERVPPPAREVEYVRVQRGPATRWVDLKGGDGTVKYVVPLAAAA
jgi:Putative zinc finger motif, C2HC5-type